MQNFSLALAGQKQIRNVDTRTLLSTKRYLFNAYQTDFYLLINPSFEGDNMFLYELNIIFPIGAGGCLVYQPKRARIEFSCGGPEMLRQRHQYQFSNR